MGLSGASGSQSSTLLQPNQNEFLNTTINLRPTPDKVLSERPYVKDTVTNQTAINTSKYPDVLRQMAAYIAGPKITVTFYHQNDNLVNERSNVSDLAGGIDPVHLAYTKIKNFQLNLKTYFDFSYLNEQTQSRFTGEAIVLPGFNPNIGDMFLYEIDRQRIGLFKINQAPTRLSIRNGTCHSIAFELLRLVSEADILELDQGVRSTAWYNEQRFLNEPGALLQSDEVLILADVDKLYYVIYQYYQDTFFDSQIYHAYMRPDQVYDPYIIDFILKTVELMDTPDAYPQQLIQKPLNWHKTVWNKLLMPDAVPWSLYKSVYVTLLYPVSFRTVATSALANRPYLVCAETTQQSDDTEDCFLPNLGEMEAGELNSFQRLLYNYFEFGNINPKLLFDLAEGYLSLTPNEQFYRIPVYMWLLSKIKNAIISGKGDIKYETSLQLPTRYAFTAACAGLSDDGAVLSIATDNNAVIGVVDNLGKQYYFQNGDVTYVNGGVEIDLSNVFLARESTEIEGTWSIVCNGGSGDTIELV